MKNAPPQFAFVYVDGWNLYYRTVRGTKYKWLNPVELVHRAQIPGVRRIRKLRYFTARALAKGDRGRSKRQHIYLKALQTLPDLHIHYGTMIPRVIRRPIANLPIAGAKILSEPPTVLPEGVHKVLGEVEEALPVYEGLRLSCPEPTRTVAVKVRSFEEKRTDVNLATHLLNDAWKDEFDAAVVITSDSDLTEPIRVVREERGKMVHVLCPSKRVAKSLDNAASSVHYISTAMLRDAQLPDPIPNTDIAKPAGW